MADTREIRALSYPSSPEVLATSAFVGRAREAETLRAAVNELMAGRGRLAILSGEAGIGKTRLAEETARLAAASGARVVWGRCWEDAGAPAFWPWIQLIRESCRLWPEKPLSPASPGLPYLLKIVPELDPSSTHLPARDPSTGLPLAEASMAPSERFLLFDAVANLFKGFAADFQLMMILDDLHASDEDSLLLLRFVARDLLQMRILVIATYRDAEAGLSRRNLELLAEISREGTAVPLRGLSVSEVGQFVEQNARIPADDSTVLALHQATDGNPFFLDEILRLFAAGHDPARQKLDATFVIPESVRAALRRRLAPLGEGTRSLLTIASLIGREFDLGLLEETSALTTEQVIAALEEAAANSVVSAVPAASNSYRFTHASMAEMLRAELGLAARVRLHRRIAEAMEKIYAHNLDGYIARIAHHYLEALPMGASDKAAEFARRGAQHARNQFAYSEASRLYGMALQALAAGQKPDRNARYELLLELGDTQARGRSLTEARKSFEEAFDVARSLGKPDLLSRAALGAAAWFSSFFAVDAGLKSMLAEALSSAGSDDTPVRAALMAKLASEYYWSGERERGRALCEDAVAAAHRIGNPRALVSALWVQNEINWGPEDVERRLGAATEIASLAESTAEYPTALRAHEMRFTALLEMGDMPGLEAEVRGYSALAEKCGEQFGIVQRFRAALALMRADLDEAAGQTGELVRHAIRRQDPALLTCAGMLNEFIATERARVDPAQIESNRKAMLTRSPAMAILARAGLAVFYASTGQAAQARDELQSLGKDDFSLIPRDWNWLAVMCWLGLVCVAVDDANRSAVVYRLLLPYANRNVTLGWGDLAYGCVGRFLGMLAWKVGMMDEAQAHFEQALNFEHRMEARLWAAYTKIEYARMLLKRNAGSDRGRAQNLIGEALDTSSASGMRLLEFRAQALMAKVRGPQPAPAAASLIKIAEPGQHRRIVATILFVDIVGSTRRVAELTDRRWVEIRQQFFDLLRGELAKCGGREIDTAGDGMLAVFDNPAEAIRSALAMSSGAHRLDLQLRAGVHTGECEMVGDDIAGIAVHLGARVAACAAADEVLVSSTVRDLMAGGDIRFADRGSHALKGIPGEWRLYAVEVL
jgi:eukaryotic-like serine/threonine-protein kinase